MSKAEPECRCHEFGPGYDPECFYHGENGTMVVNAPSASGLRRKTPLRAQPRGKGNRFEREVVDTLRAMGWTSARRNWQSGGQGGGDIIGGPADVSIECKHAEACRIWDWLEQCQTDARPTDLPLLVFRRNRSQAYACLPLDELLALLKLREEAL